MSKNKEEEALAVFKTYTRLFPNSWNAYDSYGEALLNYGHKKESIKMYRESLKLNPANNNARQVIQKITGQAPKN
jgi:tetratricopeptide (TPR) repeat protein